MPIVGGLDIHRKQLTFDYPDTVTGSTCAADQVHVLRDQLLDAARHLAGAKVLAARIYGVGPVTALR